MYDQSMSPEQIPYPKRLPSPITTEVHVADRVIAPCVHALIVQVCINVPLCSLVQHLPIHGACIATNINEADLDWLDVGKVPLVLEHGLHPVVVLLPVERVVHATPGLREAANERTITPLVAQAISTSSLVATFCAMLYCGKFVTIWVVEAV